MEDINSDGGHGDFPDVFRLFENVGKFSDTANSSLEVQAGDFGFGADLHGGGDESNGSVFAWGSSYNSNSSSFDSQAGGAGPGSVFSSVSESSNLSPAAATNERASGEQQEAPLARQSGVSNRCSSCSSSESNASTEEGSYVVNNANADQHQQEQQVEEFVNIAGSDYFDCGYNLSDAMKSFSAAGEMPHLEAARELLSEAAEEESGNGGTTVRNDLVSAAVRIPEMVTEYLNRQEDRAGTKLEVVQEAAVQFTVRPLDDVPVGNPSDKSKCDVCNAEAGKHTYYGGKVCAGCRAFFRRAVQSRYCDIFTCAKKEGRCDINQKTRRDCQFCRFQKCLRIGMKPDWVLSDSERERRFDKRRKYVTSGGPVVVGTTSAKKESAPVTALSTVDLRQQPIIDITIEDWNAIEKVHSYTKASGHKSFHEYMLGHPDFMKSLSSLGYFGGTADKACYSHFGGMYCKFTREFFFNLEEFTALPSSDLQKLIEANGCILSRFKSAVNIMEVRSCLTQRIAADTKSGLYPVLAEIQEDLSKLNIADRTPRLGYEQFYSSPWAASYDDEIRHFELMRQIKSWPRDAENKPVDGLQVTLMKLVIASSTEFLSVDELDRPDLVRRIHARHSYLLQRYLKYKYRNGEASVRFSQGLRIAQLAKEALQIQLKRLDV